MSSKACIRILSVITITLVSGLIVTTSQGRLMLQAQAIDPQTPITEPSQNSSSPSLEAPMAQPATGVPEHPGTQQAETVEAVSIKEGKALFESRCNTCHTTPRATTHTMAEWPESLNRMAPRSFLRDSEVKLILLYLKQELKPANNSEAEWDG